ncbi:MAG TPA: hypothetical protein VIN40_03955 [Candidatus Tyrphobacter sp.]
MRILSSVFAVLVVAAFAACSHGNSSSTSSTSTEASPAASAAASAAAAPAGTSGEIPSYPGATNEASASTASGSGQVLTTSDAFGVVYKWYQTHLPAGSEKSHASMAGIETATFQVGKSTIAITTNAGKTQITIATTP